MIRLLTIQVLLVASLPAFSQNPASREIALPPGLYSRPIALGQKRLVCLWKPGPRGNLKMEAHFGSIASGKLEVSKRIEGAISVEATLDDAAADFLVATKSELRLYSENASLKVSWTFKDESLIPAIVVTEAGYVVQTYSSDASHNKLWMAETAGNATVLADGNFILLQHAGRLSKSFFVNQETSMLESVDRNGVVTSTLQIPSQVYLSSVSHDGKYAIGRDYNQTNVRICSIDLSNGNLSYVSPNLWKCSEPIPSPTLATRVAFSRKHVKNNVQQGLYVNRGKSDRSAVLVTNNLAEGGEQFRWSRHGDCLCFITGVADSRKLNIVDVRAD